MKYSDLTPQQLLKRQNIWTSLLNDFCPSTTIIDEDGEEIELGRPCDRGCLCDRCHYDYELNQKYHKELLRQGLLLDDEIINDNGTD